MTVSQTEIIDSHFRLICLPCNFHSVDNQLNGEAPAVNGCKCQSTIKIFGVEVLKGDVSAVCKAKTKSGKFIAIFVFPDGDFAERDWAQKMVQLFFLSNVIGEYRRYRIGSA